MSGFAHMSIRYATTIGLALLLPLLNCCRGMGTQQFTAISRSDAHVLAQTSRVVLDVRCTNITERADYSFSENMQMLAPMPRRWKIDMTLLVERVAQGEFGEPSLRLHSLPDPTPEQSEVLGIARGGRLDFTNGMPLRVGFDSCSDEHLKNLKLMVRKE